MKILIIARLTFREAARRKIALTAALLGAAFLIFYNAAFYFVRQDPYALPNAMLARKEMVNMLLMVGLYAANFMTGVMAVLVSADSLAGEIGSGAIHALASKPLRRAEIVLGKWLGFAGLLALYVLLMAVGLILSVGVQAGYFPPNVLAGLGLMYLEALLVMSVTLAFSSRLSTLATGAAVFGLYGIAFLGGWVEQIGAMLKSNTAVDIGVFASLLMPSEALWRRAAYEMTTPLLNTLGRFSVFSFGGGATTPSPLMVAYAALFGLAAVLLAVRLFSRRDL
jgi:Cu-processing system permease protein